MTRALSALLHGDIQTATQFNRGVFFVTSVLILMAIFPVVRFVVSSMRAPESAREFRLAFVISWLIGTMAASGAVIAPAVLTDTQIARIVPVCESKAKLGKPCWFCGMTTGFIAIAHGRLREAEHANRGALPMYAGFVCNGVAAAAFLISERRRF